MGKDLILGSQELEVRKQYETEITTGLQLWRT